MSDADFLTDHLLIAMPALGDPNFYHSVTYICQHDANGALGIVINRPLGITLGEMMSQMELEAPQPEVAARPVLAGGPVLRERGFVLHERGGDWESTLETSESLAVTTSRDILVAFAEGKGPDRSLVALGYAGWDAGQLDRELTDNAWLSVKCREDILFDTPYDERWAEAARTLGVDIEQLSHPAGHA